MPKPTLQKKNREQKDYHDVFWKIIETFVVAVSFGTSMAHRLSYSITYFNS
jgi:hypothetical protein